MQRHYPRILATTNNEKKEAWKRIFKKRGDGLQISILEEVPDLIETQSIDSVHVAISKAIDARLKLGYSVLVEDVSLSFAALGGLPGAFYAPVEKKLGIEGILRLLDGKRDLSATAKVVIAFVDETQLNTVQVITAEVSGRIQEQSREQGVAGFGFDSIFVPNDCGLTFAEMSLAEADSKSPRSHAIASLLAGEWTTYPMSDSPVFHYRK